MRYVRKLSFSFLYGGIVRATEQKIIAQNSEEVVVWLTDGPLMDEFAPGRHSDNSVLPEVNDEDVPAADQERKIGRDLSGPLTSADDVLQKFAGRSELKDLIFSVLDIEKSVGVDPFAAKSSWTASKIISIALVRDPKDFLEAEGPARVLRQGLLWILDDLLGLHGEEAKEKE